MKINATAEQLKRITEILKPLYVKLYDCQSCDTKYNAQRNLAGRTHYVEDDTLRWHKSRITSSVDRANGLLFQITESCALNMNNTKRGFRCVVFDVFGTTVYHPDLERTFSSSAAAEKACEKMDFDIIGHYRTVFAERMARAEEGAAKLLTACQEFEAMAVIDGVLTESK